MSRVQNAVANDANPGGFSYLNDNRTWNFASAAERERFWNEVNKPFLDRAIKRGDRIVLTDNPFDFRSLFPKGDMSKGFNFFGREIDYLDKQGYTFKDGVALPPQH